MKQFNPMQYLAIDIANYYGLDKVTYEERIQWVKDNIDNLESYQSQAEEPILFAKAVHALRLSQAGIATGHTVALDSVCSGLQLISVMTNCKSGMQMTGLIDPDTRPDAYTAITEYMNELLVKAGFEGVTVSRKASKEAIMTHSYGSQAVPKRVFGEDLLPYFYQAMNDKCSGAMDLLSWLLASWQEIDVHSWIMPDLHTVYIPTMVCKEHRVNITELGYSPVARMYHNEATEKGIANAANMVHSVDALVLRELVRRCSYSKPVLKQYLRAHYNSPATTTEVDNDINIRFKRSQFASVTFVEMLDFHSITQISNELRERLASICEHLLNYPSFEVSTIHDSFSCSPVHAQRMREQYNEVLVELYESDILSDLLSQIYQDDITINVGEKTLSETIRNSNYGIC